MEQLGEGLRFTAPQPRHPHRLPLPPQLLRQPPRPQAPLVAPRLRQVRVQQRVRQDNLWPHLMTTARISPDSMEF